MSSQFKRIDRFKNRFCSSSDLKSMSFVPLHQISALSFTSLEPSLLVVEETDELQIAAEDDQPILSPSCTAVQDSSMSDIQNSTINEHTSEFGVPGKSELEAYINKVGQGF